MFDLFDAALENPIRQRAQSARQTAGKEHAANGSFSRPKCSKTRAHASSRQR